MQIASSIRAAAPENVFDSFCFEGISTPHDREHPPNGIRSKAKVSPIHKHRGDGHDCAVRDAGRRVIDLERGEQAKYPKRVPAVTNQLSAAEHA